MTPEERRQSAKNAAIARWTKYRAEKRKAVKK
jgi:hypothetical protein